MILIGNCNPPLLQTPRQALSSPALVVFANSGGESLGVEKRGGLRIIYYVPRKQDEIWLLTLYPKNVAENIPSHVLRQIKQEIDDEKDKSS